MATVPQSAPASDPASDTSARAASRAPAPEAALAQSRLAGVLRAASSVSIIATDLSGVIRVFNSGAERILGYSAGELLGRKTPALFHHGPEVAECCRELSERLGRPVEPLEALVGEVREGGPGVSDAREWTYVRKDGTHVPVALTVTGVYSEAGELEGFLGVGLDLTERNRLMASLRQAQVSVDNAGDMILWTRAEDGRIAYANRAARDALGYGPDELLGLEIMNINAARTLTNWRENCALLRAGGKRRYEAEFRRKDGTTLPVEANASLVTHEGVEYAVGILRDITQRKAAEARLTAGMRLNQGLAETARALLGADPDMDAIAAILLDRACEFTGSRHGYVALIDQRDGGMRPRAMSAMGALTKSGECGLGALPVTFPSGADGAYPGLWGHCLNTRQGFYTNDPAGHPSARGLRAGHVDIERLLSVPAVSKGRLVGQISLANPGRDYTQADLAGVEALADVFALGVEQVLAQRALRAAKDAAESSSRAKSEFLANMTHEVRTPLNGILGMLQVLLAGPLPQEQREYAGVALESAERLHRLLGNVIEFARLDSALEAAECLSFPPSDLLRSLEALFAQKARDKGLEFTVAAAPGLPELMLSDPRAVSQILAHLLDNALKFTPSGAVELTAGPDPDDPARLVFRVADTGVGIPEDKREQVFEAFVQADTGITRTYGGAGLGLAIARRLAERLGGGLTTAQRPGGGAVMSLTLPVDCRPPAVG